MRWPAWQHRGAILADGKTGDGCGLLLQKPDRFYRMVAQERGWGGWRKITPLA
ncbi:hypothetical protein [Sodalis glossinidius]|uniref:hypothetical protein n=1 Tax=Sodalis glossinidius TaxID=63612 RepID=UPI0002E9DA6A|nr:hypothetical protein [Sodalis glossinidius]